MTHSCFVCNAEAPNRIISGDRAKFAQQYVGPVGRAHGGISVGTLTCPALARAEDDGMANPVVSYVQGRIRAPVPLSSSLDISIKTEDGRYAVAIHDDETSYLTGVVEVVDRKLSPGEELKQTAAELDETLAELRKLAKADLTGPTAKDHQSEGLAEVGVTLEENVCFGCAESRESLQLFYRRTPSKDIWTKWALRPEYVDREGQLATAIAVAGLDCSNLWALFAQHDDLGVDLLTKQHKEWMTGTYGVRIVRIPPLEVPGGYRIVAHYLGTEGRKGFTMSALMDGEGTIYAYSDSLAIFIDFPPEELGQS